MLLTPEQEEKARDSPTLSPYAAPFHPSMEPVFLCIYNDGVPVMTLPTEQDCSAVLHGIQDDAIDERFPPDAQEAAELEAVETYVELLANLSLMEEAEERARTGFKGFAKRWEARRASGLKGRPQPAKHLVDPVQHNGLGNKNANGTTSIILHNHEAAKLTHLTEKVQTREMSRRAVEPKKKVLNQHGSTRVPIQQPRKQN